MSKPSIFRGVRVYWSLTSLMVALTMGILLAVTIYLGQANNVLRGIVADQQHTIEELIHEVNMCYPDPPGRNIWKEEK